MALINVDLAGDRRIDFRIGIHLDDAMMQADGDLLREDVAQEVEI